MGFWDGSGIGWIICKQSAANSGQTTTPTSRHSIFLQAGCSSWRPTNSIKALKANSVNTKWQINWLFSSSIRECCVGAFLARSSWRRGEPCTIQFTLHYNVQTISLNSHTHTHTHPLNGPLSGTTQVNRYHKGKTNLNFTEARDSEWQWQQVSHMQVCTSLQADNHASTSLLT